jgi:hypothetical protein
MKTPRTLLIYQVYREGVDQFYKEYIKRLNSYGFNVNGFCITLDPPGPRLSFKELEDKYKNKDQKLFAVYDALLKKTKNKDVLILFNGANLHPQFLSNLKTFNVYMCFDDPESSGDLSQPVAKYFDACFVGNIASLEQYYSWGCKNVFFRPHGLYNNQVFKPNIKVKDITNNRDIEVSLFCERKSGYRELRLSYLEKNLDNLYARGKGWPLGWVSDQEMLEIYSRTKIGLNIHNSTGPINIRTFALPANGIMQICDNKFFLGEIFTLNKEVVGFNQIEEVPELVKYYLKHDSLREKIALAGWKRTMKDYNEKTVWNNQMKQIMHLL